MGRSAIWCSGESRTLPGSAGNTAGGRRSYSARLAGWATHDIHTTMRHSATRREPRTRGRALAKPLEPLPDHAGAIREHEADGLGVESGGPPAAAWKGDPT